MRVSNGMSVFRGCMALLAPSKSSTATSQAAAAAAAANVASKAIEKPKPRARAKAKNSATSSSSASSSALSSSATEKPKTRKEPTRPFGILKVVPVSPALATFLGVSEASRTHAVKQIWSYIKLHDLQNPANKREIFCDEKLQTLFDGREKVGFLEIGKLLTHHFVKAE